MHELVDLLDLNNISVNLKYKNIGMCRRMLVEMRYTCITMCILDCHNFYQIMKEVIVFSK